MTFGENLVAAFERIPSYNSSSMLEEKALTGISLNVACRFLFRNTFSVIILVAMGKNGLKRGG